jgi:D-alanine-D-alanine ligase
MLELGLLPVPEETDGHFVWMWQTKAGFKQGTILIANIDIPFNDQDYRIPYRKEPEWIYGEGVATSRGPLSMLEYTLRALKHAKTLDSRKIGVLLHADEGLNCQYSNIIIRNAAQKAARALVLRPNIVQNSIIIDRRGQRYYYLLAEGEPKRIEKQQISENLIGLASSFLKDVKEECKPYIRTSIATIKTETKAYAMHIPHWVKTTLLMNYASTTNANKLEKAMFEIAHKKRRNYKLVKYAERPPLPKRSINIKLARDFIETADSKGIPLSCQSSSWPSVAGLIPASTAVVCGLGPYAKDLYTPNEAINRLSLIQRSLILTGFLLKN